MWLRGEGALVSGAPFVVNRLDRDEPRTAASEKIFLGDKPRKRAQDAILNSPARLSKTKTMPKAGLEPARLAAPPPQDGVSANSTTSAIAYFVFVGAPGAGAGVVGAFCGAAGGC